jgi:hypothetical protein
VTRLPGPDKDSRMPGGTGPATTPGEASVPQYLLAVHTPGEAEYESPYATPEAMEAAFAAVGAFNEALQEAGAWVFAGGLLPPASAAVVRADAAGPRWQSGPYVTSGDRVSGMWVIEVADEATARDWAERATVACGNPVEVRPFAGG